MTEPHRLPDGRLLRFAERVFDPGTVERVLRPAFTDVQHERRGVSRGWLQHRLVVLRAYWGLCKTIGICAIGDVARNPDGIASSLGGRTFVFLGVVLATLMASYASWMFAFASKYGVAPALAAGALLLPSNVLVALPVAFFFALAMFRSTAGIPPARLLPSAAVGTLACAAIVFVLLMVVAPTTNQAYRTRVFAAFQSDLAEGPAAPPRKGLPEMTLTELNTHIRNAPSSRQAELARAHRHERFAFVATVGILGLLGVALAGRWRSMVLTFAAALAIVILYGVCFGFGAGLNTRGYPAAYGTWTANAAFLVIAVRLLRSRSSTTTTVSV